MTVSIYDLKGNLIDNCTATLLQCNENCDFCPSGTDQYVYKTNP
jgi:hypothetical protein